METGFTIETMPLFRESSSGLQQMLRVGLEDPALPCRLSLSTPLWRRTFSLAGKGNGAHGPKTPLLVAVPALASPTECVCRFTAGGSVTEKRVTLTPRRRWEIHVQSFTHTDIGYTDLPSRVARGYEKALKSIIEYCDATAGFPDDSVYRWNVETGYWLEKALAGLSTQELKRVRGLVRAGRIELTPLYVAHTSEFNDDETLIRSLYFAFGFARQCGAAIRCAMASDSTGQPWLLPQALSQCGVRYFSTAVNATMAKAPRLPRPFYWGGRDGSRIMVLDTDERQAYQEGVMVGLTENPSVMQRKLPEYLLDLECNGGYPFDLLALRAPGYPGDNSAPNIEVSRNVKAWNETWAFPRLRVSTYTPFFRELEERYGERIPVFTGAWPDWWTLYHGATAFEAGVNRNTHADLHAAERLSVILAAGGGRAGSGGAARSGGAAGREAFPYPATALREAYATMLCADEADWGSYSSVSDPDGLQARGQRAENQAFVYQVAINAQSIAEQARTALARDAASRTGKGILVTNTAAWKRSGVVTVSVPESYLAGGKGIRIREAGSGREIDAQVLEVQADRPAVRVAFRADDVPALGFAAYDIEPGPEAPPVDLRDSRVANAFYEVSWDARTGLVNEIRDRESGANLIDTGSPYGWGQLIYETPEKPRVFSLRDHMGLPDDLVFLQPYYRSIHDFYDYPPKGARLRYSSPSNARLHTARSGRLFTEIASSSSMDLFPDFTFRLVLDNTAKRILLVCDIDRIETLQAEGVYVAFPFMAPDPVLRLSCHGGWFQPGREQLPGSCTDWYCVQKWLGMEAGGRWVTWSPIEAPLVQFGSISTGQWRDEINVKNGTLFSYIMNNYWWTNSPAAQGGRFHFRYALTSGMGALDPAGACRFGEDAHLPLAATVFEKKDKAGHPRGSFLAEPLPPNVTLVGMKEAEDGEGIIMRFLEMAGTDARFPLALSGKRIRGAYLVTPVEDPSGPLKTGSSGVRIRLRPFECATVRIKT